jgi:CBS domain-containing protein
MKAGELAHETVATIGPQATLIEAADAMRENHVGDLVVVEQQGGTKRPIGIITDRDLVLALSKSGPDGFVKKTVGDRMSQVLIMARRDDPVEEVLGNMRDNGVRRLPVVDVDDNLVGILTYDDFVGYLGDQLMSLGELVQSELSREITGKTAT